VAFPTQTATLARDLERAQLTAADLKRAAQNANTRMAGQSVSYDFILAILERLKSADAVFATTQGRAGIATYAQEQLGQNIVQDFTDMRAAAQSAFTTIRDLLPVQSGPNAYLQARTIDAQGNVTDRTFAPAQTAGVRTALDTVIATIE